MKFWNSTFFSSNLSIIKKDKTFFKAFYLFEISLFKNWKKKLLGGKKC